MSYHIIRGRVALDDDVASISITHTVCNDCGSVVWDKDKHSEFHRTLSDSQHFHTKSGRVLSNEDIEALAEEAERGYDVSKLKKKPPRPTR